MWFKKEIRSGVNYSSVDSIVTELANKYKTSVVLKPKFMDKRSKYKIIVQVYLPIPAYVITVQEDFANEQSE